MPKYKAITHTWVFDQEHDWETNWRYYEADTPEAVIPLAIADETTPDDIHLIKVYAEEDTAHTTVLAMHEDNFHTAYKTKR
jgi:hypothetical protein